MAEPIGRADWELRADQTGLVKDLGDAEKKVAASGAAVQKSAINTGTAFKAGAAVAAVGFGLMAKGSLEMEAAQGDFQAATGKSKDAAVAFSKDMNGIVGTAGTVGVSFGKIAETGTMVEQQFGTTGEATQQLTDDIFEFSKVAGGDATANAAQLEDTLSSYGLTANDASGFMDKLVLSNQKYGTEAGPETLGILQKMSPALQAMGADLDDGIGLLNLFETGGIDAASAQKGLNGAIEKLPPGTTLEEFVQHLVDMKNQGLDPTSEAIDVFGTKAGAGLALAIKPGMTGLGDFKVSAEEADGATQKAAENMLTTGDKIKQFAEKAGAALRGMGQEFGPILSGAGGLVSVFGALPNKVTGPLVDGMKAVWKKLIPGAIAGGTAAGAAEAEAETVAATETGMLNKWLTKFGLMTPAKVAAATAAGAAEGVAEGEAAAGAASGPGVLSKFKTGGGLMGAAMGLGIVVAVAAAANEYGPQIGQAGHDMGRQVFGGIAEQMGSTESKGILEGTVVDSLTDGIHSGLDAFFDSPVARFNFYKDGRLLWMSPSNAEVAAGEGMQALASHITDEAKDRLPTASYAIANTVVDSFADGVDASPSWTDTATAVADKGGWAVSEGWKKVAAETNLQPFKDLGKAVPSEIGSGIVENSTAVLSAADKLIDVLKNGMTPAEEAAKLEGEKYTKAVAQGVVSEIPGAKEAAQQMAVAAISTIDKAADGTPSTKSMKAIGSYYASLLASGLTAEQARVALAAAGVSQATIAKLDAQSGQYNQQGQQWDTSLAAGIEQQHGKINTAASNATDPLHNQPVTDWGHAVGNTWVNSVAQKIASGQGDINWAVKKALAATHGESPPKEGPLQKIDKWGENIAGAWIGGMVFGVVHGKDKLEGAIGRITLAPKSGGLKLPGDVFQPGPRTAGKAEPRQLDHTECVHLNIGTLIADEAGLAELSRRLDHAAAFSGRKRLPVGGAY